ncbi:MAG: hypothetical protein M3164_06655, partial [Actinomycetota bacterium]|nr:hypothetical protein [Actinomycetota bacterium]
MTVVRRLSRYWGLTLNEVAQRAALPVAVDALPGDTHDADTGVTCPSSPPESVVPPVHAVPKLPGAV